MSKIEFYCADCIDILRDYPNGFFSLTFASPPYAKARSYGIGFNLKGEEYIQWCADRFEECYRVTSGLTAWVMEGQTRNFEWDANPVMLMAELKRRGIRLRKPPIFHRVGIPGSGGPDYLRNDYESIIVASHGKLPWSDPTACGHEPKWKPGGAMSHQTRDGRINEKKVQDYLDGKLAGKLHTKRNENNTRIQCYTPPKKANPGNVISCLTSIEDIFLEILSYGYACKRHPAEVLYSLRKAHEEEKIFEWCFGISKGLQSEKLLRPDMYGIALEDAQGDAVPILRKVVSSEKQQEDLLQQKMLFRNESGISAGEKEEDPGNIAARKVIPEKESCEHCGTDSDLIIHHIDENPCNNNPKNLMVLCRKCHGHHHNPNLRKSQNCVICGKAPSKNYRKYGILCDGHYRRFKRYGDPNLVKKKHGTTWILVNNPML